MTIRLFFVLVYWLLDTGFFIAAIATNDPQKRQARLLLATYFAVAAIAKILGAIAIHTGAFPLWNNK